MAPSALLSLYLASITILCIATLVSAQGETSKEKDSSECPDGLRARMVYSAFKPYFKFDMFSDDARNCWIVPDCLFEAAGESRKQLFATTALVMGVIPLAIKDIVSPQRRLILVTKRLHRLVEVLVLALGLVPIETGDHAFTRRRAAEGNLMAKAAWRLTRTFIGLWILFCMILMFGTYVALVWLEVYSKRSVLGCSFPAFIAIWFAASLVPACIHSIFASIRRRRYRKEIIIKQISSETGEIDPEVKRKFSSHVQGADQDWPVQIAWLAYYVAGTQIFTSIMAVTLVELVCWAALAFFMTGCQKVLGFFLCLLFERTDTLSDEDWE